MSVSFKHTHKDTFIFLCSDLIRFDILLTVCNLFQFPYLLAGTNLFKWSDKDSLQSLFPLRWEGNCKTWYSYSVSGN